MKELSKRATFYLIALIFFFMPIFFSHLFKALGFPLILGSSSYERIKVELFYSFLLILIPFWIYSPFFKKSREFFRSKKHILWIVIFLTLLSISTILAPDLQTAFWWGTEKQHGALFFIALGFFTIPLATLPEIYKNTFIKISFVSLSFVLFYATMQWMGIDQLWSRYILGFSGNRVFSTLGNPNYLAGYLILFLPLVPKIIKTGAMRNFWYILISFGVVISGSLIGIGIVFGYCVFLLFSRYKKTRIGLLFIVFLSIVSIGILSPISLAEKLGSMEHRMIIWETGIRAVFSSPERMLFGYGPEQFRTVFPLFVTGKDIRYFEDNTPDRAHNILLDVLFSFGTIGLGFFLILLVIFFKKHPISSPNSQVMMFFLLFFSFNIPVLVHFLIVALAVSLRDWRSYAKWS